MDLDVRRQGMETSAAVTGRLEERLEQALGRFSHRIGRITVYLGNHTGPRPAEDKSCRILVHLQRGGEVLVEGHGADLYALIDRTARQAGEAVIRQLGRRRTRRRAGL